MMLVYRGGENWFDRGLALIFILIVVWLFPVWFAFFLSLFFLTWVLLAEKEFRISSDGLLITYTNILNFLKFRYNWSEIQKVKVFPSGLKSYESIEIYLKNGKVKAFQYSEIIGLSDFILEMRKYVDVDVASRY